jgi:hypothetical protein
MWLSIASAARTELAASASLGKGQPKVARMPSPKKFVDRAAIVEDDIHEVGKETRDAFGVGLRADAFRPSSSSREYQKT